MRKALRILGWTAAAGALLLAAAAVAAKLYFTPARLKALTLDYAARNLRREISFDSVKLDLTGLAISGLRVSEYPDFKKGEFLSAEAFSVRPSLRALLHGRLSINSVTASGLKLKVKELKKDTYNFSDLVAPAAPAPAARPAARKEAAPQLSVSSLRIKSSRFSYANAAGDMRVELRDIDLAASDISPDGLFPVSGSFALDVASPYFKGSLPVKLKGRLALGNFNVEKGRAEIEKASLALGGVKAELKGSLTNLMEPDARISVAVKQFSTADLKGVVKGLPAKVLLPEIDADADFKLTLKDVRLRSVAFKAGAFSGSLKGRAAWEPKTSYDLSADVKATLPEGDTTQLARRLKQFPIPRGLKLPMISVSASAVLRDGRAEVRKFSLDCDALSASGSASADFGGAALRASGSAKAEVKSLAKLAAVAPDLTGDYKLSGAASAALDFSLGAALAVKGSAALRGAGGEFAGHALSALNGSADFTLDSVSAQKLEGRLDGEPFTASFRAKDVLKHPKAEFDVKLAKLALKDLPAGQPAAGQPKPAEKRPQFYADVAGRAEVGAIQHPNFSCGPASLKLDLRNISQDLKALDGTASFTAGPGKFSDLYALAGKYKAAKVALYPLIVLQKASKLVKTLKLPDFNDVAFDRIEGDYSFAKGLMRLNKSSLTASVADASSTGTIDLPSEKLDMRLSTELKKASGISMSAPVVLNVKGTLSDPSVKPDVKSLVEQPAIKKAVEKVLPGADKLLKGLFKK